MWNKRAAQIVISGSCMHLLNGRLSGGHRYRCKTEEDSKLLCKSYPQSEWYYMKIKISAVTSGRNTAEYSRSTKMETSKQMLNVECPGLKRKHFSEETRKRATAIVHTQKKRQKPGYTGKH